MDDPHAGPREETPRQAASEQQQMVKITAAEFQKAVTAQRAELAKLKALPEGMTADQWKVLKTKAISITFNADTAALWEVVARNGDVAHLGRSGFPASELSRKPGLHLVVGNEQSAAIIETSKHSPPASVVKAATGLDNTDTTTVDSMLKTAEIAHKKGKHYMALPHPDIANNWGPEKAGEMCKQFDEIMLPFADWCNLDRDKTLGATMEKLARYSQAIRKANPRCRIFLDVGRPDGQQPAPKVAAEWFRVLSIVCEKDPKLFDGIHFTGMVRDKTNDPGVPPTKQFLAWLRMN
jgi:hypothetical protein